MSAFPRLHVRPASGWVNDPNGPVRWGDRYHLFFQHNPDAPVPANMNWGHASSPDLVSWTIEPIALRPTPGGPDSAGCWSGCVIDDGGVPTAVYTGVTDDSGIGSICLAYGSPDLRSWTPDSEPVCSSPGGLIGFRDPFVFSVDGRRYAIVGAGSAGGGTPQVLVYDCADLHDWRPLGSLLSATDPVAGELAPADLWECPQLFRLGDRWVLVVSLWTRGGPPAVVQLVGCLEVDDTAPRFTPSAGGAVDTGPDFYAPAVLVSDNRVLLWGWTWEHRAGSEVAATGWAGALTFPRELSLDGDRLVGRPAPELRLLRGEPSGEPASGSFEFRTEAAATLRTGTSSARIPGSATVFVDGSVVEIYPDDGTPHTQRVYPDGPWTVDGPVAVWPLRRPSDS